MKNLWSKLLDQRIAPQRSWQEILGSNFESASRYLIPTGATADFLPCVKTPLNHCGHKVRPGSDDGIFVGYCPDGECARIDLSLADIALLSIDWNLLLAEIGASLGLDGQPVLESPGFGQIAWIAPGQGVRFPVFFGAPSNGQSVFPALQRFAGRSTRTPFAFVTLSRDSLDVDSLGILASGKVVTVFLDAEVAFDKQGNLSATDAAARLLKFAVDAVVSSRSVGPSQMILPQGADWQDVTIKEIDGHTIEFFCQVRRSDGTREVRHAYTFENLGLSKRTSKGPKPSIAWERFLMPILHGKRIVASSSDEWSRMRKWKEEVAGILHTTTGLPADEAFADHRGRNCYEANFKVDCDPRDIVPVPDAPRRLNQKGQIAKGSYDE